MRRVALDKIVAIVIALKGLKGVACRLRQRTPHCIKFTICLMDSIRQLFVVPFEKAMLLNQYNPRNESSSVKNIVIKLFKENKFVREILKFKIQD